MNPDTDSRREQINQAKDELLIAIRSNCTRLSDETAQMIDMSVRLLLDVEKS